jgi:hypothetical protein
MKFLVAVILLAVSAVAASAADTAAAPSPTILSIGQAFGPLVQPYVDAIVMALITALFTWLGRQKIVQNIDTGFRNTLETALKNQASSLVADGFVKLNGVKVDVRSEALVKAANIIAQQAAPAAVKHFGLTPEVIAAKIIDTLPQQPVVAMQIANAAAATPATPQPQP